MAYAFDEDEVAGLVEPGINSGKLIDIEDKVSQAGNDMSVMTFDFDGLKIKHYLTYNEKNRGMTNMNICRICDSLGFPRPAKGTSVPLSTRFWSRAIGRIAKVELIREDGLDGKKYLKIDKFLESEDARSLPPQTKSAPVDSKMMDLGDDLGAMTEDADIPF